MCEKASSEPGWKGPERASEVWKLSEQSESRQVQPGDVWDKTNGGGARKQVLGDPEREVSNA